MLESVSFATANPITGSCVPVASHSSAMALGAVDDGGQVIQTEDHVLARHGHGVLSAEILRTAPAAIWLKHHTLSAAAQNFLKIFES